LDRPHAPTVRYSTWFSGSALLWITWPFFVQISLRTAARGERLTSGLGGHSKGQFSRRPRRAALPLSTGEGWFFFHREPSEHERKASPAIHRQERLEMKTMIFALAMAASLGAMAIPAFARGGGGGEGSPYIDPNGFPPGFFDGVPGASRIIAQQNTIAAAERPQTPVATSNQTATTKAPG
jgi:hypothetical protein